MDFFEINKKLLPRMTKLVILMADQKYIRKYEDDNNQALFVGSFLM